MAKQSGLGDNFYVAGVDLSGDTCKLDRISTPRGTLPSTGINKSAQERMFGRRDGGMEFTTYFNPAVGGSHDLLSNLPTADVVVTYCRSTVLGAPAAGMVAKQIDYNGTRGEDGSFTFATTAESNTYGLDWGVQLTAGIRSDTGAANGTSVDGAAASSFGLQAYLHVFSFTGTDATIKIQESSDNAAGDPFADVTGGGFTAVTAAPTSQRIATATNLAVERYLRVVTTTSGGFSAMTFAVMVCRNPAVPVL